MLTGAVVLARKMFPSYAMVACTAVQAQLCTQRNTTPLFARGKKSNDRNHHFRMQGFRRAARERPEFMLVCGIEKI